MKKEYLILLFFALFARCNIVSEDRIRNKDTTLLVYSPPIELTYLRIDINDKLLFSGAPIVNNDSLSCRIGNLKLKRDNKIRLRISKSKKTYDQEFWINRSNFILIYFNNGEIVLKTENKI